ncbi:LOW QUALITY PROTEIN: adenylate cyclase type 10 [Colletes latitarsis]|uniref:LOW QUALITY PROTEIN: adenylate cyclase type 10 n=1 Tax=Colletes latitarsis TaxID=2605962 RepID=UPI004035E43D
MESLEEMETVWTPDLVGPIFKRHTITLREVLDAHRDDKSTKSMATFIPDELIYEPDLTRKNFRKFNAVMALIDVSRLFDLYEKYNSAENGGSYALVALLNSYIGVIIEGVYSSYGDVLKISRDVLLVMWKANAEDFFARMVYNVILHAQVIQARVATMKGKIVAPLVDIVLSAGEMTFSVIGDDSARHFVITGSPIEDLKRARRICLPGDLVLSSSAWEHCAPSQYEYVIKDSDNVKIIKVLGPPVEPEKPNKVSFLANLTSDRMSSADYETHSDIISTISDISMYSDVDLASFQARVSVFDALKRRLGGSLKTYMMELVFKQIHEGVSLNYLTEVKRVTVVVVNVLPSKCSTYEFISLVDQLFRILQRIIEEYSGQISVASVYDKDILFHVLYGIEGYSDRKSNMNRAKRGILSASRIMEEMKRIIGVKAVFVGVSTGMAFCGVIGHPCRRQYMIFGTPIDRATSLMMISFGKISCDYDTVFYSRLSRERFRSRGMKTLKGFGKYYVYEILDTFTLSEEFLNIEYIYPILGRFQEVEYFKDILDDIGVHERSYSGILIEVRSSIPLSLSPSSRFVIDVQGQERSGKSRLLDAFVTIVRNRQIKLVQLPLHESFAEKEYAVLYYVLLQMFDAMDCTTIDDRERVLLNKLTDILAPEDFCYLNVIMRVQFPLSREYCRDSDWKRHRKTIKIFGDILTQVAGHVCILLDDVQYMDVLSWQFLSAALDKDNVVLVMTLLEPVSWDNLSQVEAGICEDKRLMNRALLGLGSEYLSAFACQFLNVSAIPRTFESILRRRSKNSISWCEAFLMSALQAEAITFLTLSPMEVKFYNLVFPDCSLLAKIPADMTPEELAPPLHWSQMSAINVCVSSGKPLSFLETDRDVTGLRIDIYNRMNSYEQDFIKCAASLGTVFLRSMLESVMTNFAPLYTAKGNIENTAVAEMVRLRILECGMIQRKHFHIDDSLYYLFKRRRTFSNVQHSVICECRPPRIFGSRTLPLNAHCMFLEFTIASYRKLLYDILPPHEKKEYHSKAAGIFQRDARKCTTCGSDNFLSIFTKELTTPPPPKVKAPPSAISLSLQRRATIHSRSDLWESRRSIFLPENMDPPKKRDSINFRRTSILPVYTDNDDDDDHTATSEHAKQASDSSETAMDVSWEIQLKNFNHIDYRNCRCSYTISFLFWTLNHHIRLTNDLEELLKFMLEYSAGLLQTAQPAFATKFLANTNAHIEITKIKEHIITDVKYTTTNEGSILVLLGDAYVAYGYYSQAKKYYTEASALRTVPLQTAKEVCYSTMMEKLRYMLRGFSSFVLNQVSGKMAVEKLELAVYMERLSTVLLLEDQPKIARLIVLQGLRAAFQSVAGFVEKGRIYVIAAKIFRRYGNFDLLYDIEWPMTMAIEEKTSWDSAEELTVLAEVYQTLYENRVLRGKLEEGIEIGIKLLKICNCLRINRIKFAVLPSLIEVLVWTKHLNEAVDLLRELYYCSKEDVDKSAITWYYALSLELLLDAGMVLESYDTCFAFHSKVTGSRRRACVSRDPESLMRLTTCLGIWQLRMNVPVIDEFILDVKVITKGIHRAKFSQIYNCVKSLESYLLILNRRINIKQSSDLIDRVQDVKTIIGALRDLRTDALFVMPFLYLMRCYMSLQRSRTITSRIFMKKSRKWSLYQGNQMMLAWTMQIKRTWTGSYNNMARYWTEHVGTADAIQWQEIHNFDLDTWSTIMFPLPIPVSSI